MDFTKIFVGGEWREGRGGLTDSIDPADGSLVARRGVASVDDVDDAVAAGLQASADPEWRNMLPHQRARILARIGDAIEADVEAISALQTADTGKTRAETRALALSAAGTFRYFAAALETMDETLTSPRGSYLTMSVHEPIGVVGAITPWNSPIASDAQKIAPALAAGNAVVLKPAEWTSLVSLHLARLVEQQGLPRGLLSVLPGPGSVIGDAIVRHRGVGKILFTGGTTTGRRIAAVAAEKLMPVSLELGGKSPTIVLEDADMDQAIAGILFGIFSSSGQSCIAGSRLFVDRSIYDAFVPRLVERAAALRIGPGTSTETQVAPLVSTIHRDQVAAHVERALAAGATLLCGGEAPSGPEFDQGAYYRPTILAGVPNDAVICQEEIFGPVLVVLPFDGEEDLVAQANDTVFGLAAGIWSRDFPRAYRLARRLEAGTVWVNTYKQFSISTPFGGWKESGLGVEKGRDGIRAHMRQKSIYLGLDSHPLPWA
ncbi:aldehyde dehydrogenase [Sphingomonas sp. IC081]|uniref:aldehyde dehydrogenase n=1 Tax=Sphingomonas sp. IC081 TaxID=304378 RepID=UPI00115C33FD|nr:aldehyde dehydrogenase [Sphingomonas sp. IC081]QDK35703.1 aldehyde dehydrogenase [Sphingomonas sp. IC081]